MEKLKAPVPSKNARGLCAFLIYVYAFVLLWNLVINNKRKNNKDVLGRDDGKGVLSLIIVVQRSSAWTLSRDISSFWPMLNI